jgi:hypothetical protein
LIVQVPYPATVTVEPLTVQIAGVTELNDTSKPELAVAPMFNVDCAVINCGLEIAVKLIV